MAPLSPADLSAPVNDLDLFHFDDSRPCFNGLSRENGFVHWCGRDLMAALGYQEWNAFHLVINRAIGVCMTLGIDVTENFERFTRDDGRTADCKLSRFACYLTAMNADSRKPEVARAQAYFAAMAEAFRRYVEEAEEVERVTIRDDVSKHEKGLSRTAHQAGVVNYAFFQNAGYRGLYNMNLADVRFRKGVAADACLLDFMGKEELAANLFRITQTDARIRNQRISGQRNLEEAANSVGAAVRRTMIDLSGTRPEDLPAERNIKDVRGDLKASHREFAKLDRKPKRKK